MQYTCTKPSFSCIWSLQTRQCPMHCYICMKKLLSRTLCVLVCLQLCLQLKCVLNSGGECCWHFHTTGQNGSYYPYCDCLTSVCMCITAGCFSPRNPPHTGDKEPHQATARFADHLEWYRNLSSSCFKGRDQNYTAIFFIWFICLAFNPHKKQHNYRHIEKPLCQTAYCTVVFSPLPFPNLSWAQSHWG